MNINNAYFNANDEISNNINKNFISPIKGISRFEYIPYEKTYIEYKAIQKSEQIPIERKYIDYQSIQKFENIPIEKKQIDYFTIEHRTRYFPSNNKFERTNLNERLNYQNKQNYFINNRQEWNFYSQNFQYQEIPARNLQYQIPSKLGNFQTCYNQLPNNNNNKRITDLFYSESQFIKNDSQNKHIHHIERKAHHHKPHKIEIEDKKKQDKI